MSQSLNVAKDASQKDILGNAPNRKTNNFIENGPSTKTNDPIEHGPSTKTNKFEDFLNVIKQKINPPEEYFKKFLKKDEDIFDYIKNDESKIKLKEYLKDNFDDFKDSGDWYAKCKSKMSKRLHPDIYASKFDASSDEYKYINRNLRIGLDICEKFTK